MPVVIGVDLGQQKDPSAIAVVEQGAQVTTLSGQQLPTIVEVTHLERISLGTPYDVVRDRVAKLAEALHWLDPEIVIDAGGPGRPVIDELRAKGLKRVISVTTTGGASEQRVKVGFRDRGEDWNVAKSCQYTGLSTLIYSSRLKVAKALPDLKAFQQELQTLEHRVSEAGRETYTGGDATHHADLVSAVALGCWRLLQPRFKGGNFRLDTVSR